MPKTDLKYQPLYFEPELYQGLKDFQKTIEERTGKSPSVSQIINGFIQLGLVTIDENKAYREAIIKIYGKYTEKKVKWKQKIKS